MYPIDSLRFFGPELLVTAAVVVVLLLDLVMKRRAAAAYVLSWTALAGLAAAGLAMLPAAGAGGRSLFYGMVALDPAALFFKCFFLVVGFLGVIFAALSDEIEKERLGEFLALLLSLVLGMMLLASASNLLMVYLALEFVSIASYVLAGWRRRNLEGSEAALKYVIYGGAASGMMLYGLSLLYGLTGSLDIADVGVGLSVAATGGAAQQVALTTALVLAFAGFAYKIAAVPFHMWCPDVYQGAPTPFTAFLSVGPKAAGFAVLIRFLYVALPAPEGGEPSFPWPLLLGVVAAATMTLGNLVALVQTNLKRLLAYSSIAHAGYLLLGLVVANGDGVHAILLYLCFYLLMNLGAFLAVMAVRDATGGQEDVAGCRGLAARAPVVAVLFAVFLFSLVGLPPLAGFIGKFYLFAALLHKGGWTYWVLALIGVVNSAISLYYYAGVVRAMFLDAPADGPARLAVKPAYVVLLFILALPTLALGIYWYPLSDALHAAAAVFGG